MVINLEEPYSSLYRKGLVFQEKECVGTLRNMG